MEIKREYARWLENATGDQDVAEELRQMDEAQIEDAFYRDLAFGTGGLRGVIGAGTNRMNIYTVAKASQGLADYLNQNYSSQSKGKPCRKPRQILCQDIILNQPTVLRLKLLHDRKIIILEQRISMSNLSISLEGLTLALNNLCRNK